MFSSTKSNKLSVDTNLDAVTDFDNGQPSLASFGTLITSTSTFSTVDDDHRDSSETNTTPRNGISKTEREKLAKAFVIALGLEWGVLEIDQRRRAMRIMSPDYTWSPNRGNIPQKRDYFGTTFEGEWKTFVQSLEGELKEAFFRNYNNVFFNEEAVTDYMVIRRQRSGICSSHASVTIQHYVASKRRRDGNNNTKHSMLDVSSYIQRHLPKDKQRRYIEHGSIKMNSIDLLKAFTGTADADYMTLSFQKKEVWGEKQHQMSLSLLYEAFCESNEPCIVGSFKVCGDEFYNGSVLEGSSDQKSEKTMHAMVLIGVYHSEKDDRYWFVLQNSHEDHYFKLIDGEYLASCGATAYFAPPNLSIELKEGFDVTTGDYFEASGKFEECMPKYPEEG